MSACRHALIVALNGFSDLHCFHLRRCGFRFSTSKPYRETPSKTHLNTARPNATLDLKIQFKTTMAKTKLNLKPKTAPSSDEGGIPPGAWEARGGEGRVVEPEKAY